MAVWTIDGTLEAAEEKRRRGEFVLFSRLTIREAGGAEHALKNVCAAGEVAKALKPGARGRFYLTKALDQTGVHGVRLEGGASALSFYSNLEVIMLIGLGAGAFMLVVAVVGDPDFFITPIVLLPLFAIGYWLVRKAKSEGLAQFEADAAG